MIKFWLKTNWTLPGGPNVNKNTKKVTSSCIKSSVFHFTGITIPPRAPTPPTAPSRRLPRSIPSSNYNTHSILHSPPSPHTFDSTPPSHPSTQPPSLIGWKEVSGWEMWRIMRLWGWKLRMEVKRGENEGRIKDFRGMKEKERWRQAKMVCEQRWKKRPKMSMKERMTWVNEWIRMGTSKGL